jgi:hypothetical protein
MDRDRDNGTRAVTLTLNPQECVTKPETTVLRENRDSIVVVVKTIIIIVARVRVLQYVWVYCSPTTAYCALLPVVRRLFVTTLMLFEQRSSAHTTVHQYSTVQ